MDKQNLGAWSKPLCWLNKESTPKLEDFGENKENDLGAWSKPLCWLDSNNCEDRDEDYEDGEESDGEEDDLWVEFSDCKFGGTTSSYELCYEIVQILERRGENLGEPLYYYMEVFQEESDWFTWIDNMTFYICFSYGIVIHTYDQKQCFSCGFGPEIDTTVYKSRKEWEQYFKLPWRCQPSNIVLFLLVRLHTNIIAIKKMPKDILKLLSTYL